MPARLSDDEIEMWITRGGKKIPIPTSEAEERTGGEQGHKFNVGGEKASASREAAGHKEATEEPRSQKTEDTAKSLEPEHVTYDCNGWGRTTTYSEGTPEERTNLAETREMIKYIQRHAMIKSRFNTRDLVFYERMQKAGVVAGIEGDHVRILNQRGSIDTVHKDYVYKETEMTKYGHWDAISNRARLSLLKSYNLSTDYATTDWHFLPEPIRKAVSLKAMGPAGYEGAGVNTVTRGVFNPVNQDMTLDQRMKEHERAQPYEGKETSHEEEKERKVEKE